MMRRPAASPHFRQGRAGIVEFQDGFIVHSVAQGGPTSLGVADTMPQAAAAENELIISM
ncbi:MAG: hypothetical protein HQK56_13660, partial [Deltaproteobacteria bacterium]|nr:hypothetical protein [Deltaproteobacteria bacterium]